jgi:hypothetical protein
MISGFRFISVTFLGAEELKREVGEVSMSKSFFAELKKDLTLKKGIPKIFRNQLLRTLGNLTKKHFISVSVVQDDPFVVDVLFKERLFQVMKKLGIKSDSDVVLSAEKEFCKDLQCNRNDDYLLEYLEV